MKKYYIIILAFFITNCTLNKVIDHHGVHFLDKKNKMILISQSNKNDILSALGSPSTKSTFDDDIWIYIERKSTHKAFYKFGDKKILTNNVLILEIGKNGFLKNKLFLDINNMNDVNIAEQLTSMTLTKNKFIFDFLRSLRQKINDPLGKKTR